MTAEFVELTPGTGLLYRVEQDGSVSLTGRWSTQVIHARLPDGSLLQGGISSSGPFGERLVRDQNSDSRYPIKWHEQALPVQVQVPGPRGPTVCGTIIDLRVPERSNLEISPTRPIRAYIPDYVPGRIKRTQYSMFRKTPPTESSELKETVQVLKHAEAEITALQSAYWRLKNDTEKLQIENSNLQHQLSQRDFEAQELKSKLARAQTELSRKVDRRVLQLGAVPTSELKTDTLSSVAVEVEDSDNLVKYLVVTTVPPRTSTNTITPFVEGLREKIQRMVGVGRSEFALLPTGFSVQVFELIPLGGSPDNQEF